jgi:alpha-1,3-rhamnosyltransferase
MADGRLMTTPLVSINIPAYRQLPYLRECIACILAQTFDDYEINVIDDAAADDCRDYVASLANPRVHYRANVNRLGAMPNMFHAIFAGEGKYTLAFHEDDLLSPGYLRAAVKILESRPECGIVTAEVREFRDGARPDILQGDSESPAYELFASQAEFVRGILKGIQPMFGSVVYRRAAIAGVRPDHDRYGTLVDRPFLLSILEKWTAAVIRDPVAWYRGHGENDDRHEGMSSANILELIKTYRAALPERMHIHDEALFFPYAAEWLTILYRLTPNNRKPSMTKFIYQAWRAGLYNPRWERRFGLSRLRHELTEPRAGRR